MQFRVDVPFGPFETGDRVTEADVFARVPGADLARLVRLKSLVPADGAAALLVPAATPVSEAEAELVAALQKRVEDAEAERDLHREAADRLTAERDAMAARVKELEAEKTKAAEKTTDKPPAPPTPAPPAPAPMPARGPAPPAPTK